MTAEWATRGVAMTAAAVIAWRRHHRDSSSKSIAALKGINKKIVAAASALWQAMK
jgi:hypothetical protein